MAKCRSLVLWGVVGSLVLGHLLHSFFEVVSCAGLHCLLLDISQTCIHVLFHLVNVVGVVCSEPFDSRSQESEKGLQEEFVDNFGAHKRTEGQLKPDQKEKFERVVEGDD